jgi:Nucleotidyl transferase AbiEii toxin, Type IV TA system
VETGTLDLIKRLSADEKFNDFNLVGGTALALQIGHRISVDIDLFAKSEFDSLKMADYLEDKYKAVEVQTSRSGVFCFVDGIKIDMLTHDYNWLAPPSTIENIRLASLDDIAAMKVHAIVNSGARLRDFADMYFILEHRNLDQVLKAYINKYPNSSTEIAKLGLLYYNQISTKTDINYIGRERNWPEITERLKEAVVQPGKKFVRDEPDQQFKPDDPNLSQTRRHGRSR